MARTARAPDPDRARKVLAAAEAREMDATSADNVRAELVWHPVHHDPEHPERVPVRRLVLDLDDLGPGDDMISRAQTSNFVGGEGFPITGMLAKLSDQDVTRIGTDAVVLVLWMARRKNGETGLTFEECMAQAGSSTQVMKEVTIQVRDHKPEVGEDRAGGPEAGPLTTHPGPSSPNGSAYTRETSSSLPSLAASPGAS